MSLTGFPHAGAKRGTRDPVAFRDSGLGLIRLRAHGAYSIQVLQPALLINRLAGTQGMYSPLEIEDYLSEAIVSRFNDLMGETIDTVFKLPGRYEELSAGLVKRLQEDFSHFGLGLQAPAISWGVLLKDAQAINVLAGAPWLLIPGALAALGALCLIVLIAIVTYGDQPSLDQTMGTLLIAALIPIYIGGVFLFSYGYEIYDIPKALRLTAIIVFLTLTAVFMFAVLIVVLGAVNEPIRAALENEIQVQLRRADDLPVRFTSAEWGQGVVVVRGVIR